MDASCKGWENVAQSQPFYLHVCARMRKVRLYPRMCGQVSGCGLISASIRCLVCCKEFCVFLVPRLYTDCLLAH